MADRFYVNCPLGPGRVLLDGPEAHHLAAVSRLRPGDPVRLFNGDGREYPAVVAAVRRREVELDVTGVETPDRELGFRLEVAAPLPKGDRAQFLVEKLTELGVTTLVPLQTGRSVVHPREAKLDKLQRYVIEASKQCGRNVLLRVEPLTEWATYCRREDLPALRLVAHPGQEGQAEQTEVQGGMLSRPFEVFAIQARSSQGRESMAPGGVALAVGPEGGFTEEEVALAAGHGWRRVGLGRRVLRVETAALVLAALAGVAPESGGA